MPVDIREHPDAPDLERIQDVTVDPVPRGEIERRREEGYVLVEDKLRERADLDIRLELNDEPGEAYDDDVGTVLYRYCQLFGTPQLPEYQAGEDISDREDEVFKYLLRASVKGEDHGLPNEWLFTVYDWRVELGASIAEWQESEESGSTTPTTLDADFEADTDVALTTLQFVHNVGNEPVQCEYEGIWF